MESIGDLGEKRVLIENRAVKIQILLVYSQEWDKERP